jgi:hypothetical protein
MVLPHAHHFLRAAEIGQAFLSSSPFDFLSAAHLPLSSANSPASGASVHVDFYLTVCPEQERDFSDGSWRFYQRPRRENVPAARVYPSA